MTTVDARALDNSPLGILHRVFGYDAFRGQQSEIAVVAQRAARGAGQLRELLDRPFLCHEHHAKG